LTLSAFARTLLFAFEIPTTRSRIYFCRLKLFQLGCPRLMAKTSRPELRPRFRITRGPKIAFGPGKADLLERVARTGSIGAAAASMGMSYMRAWSLIREMNKYFKQPVIASVRGGHERGGAALTPTGRRVLDLYRQMETDSLGIVQRDWQTLRKLLRP
jgi:molybdate transport system regulatory protein